MSDRETLRLERALAADPSDAVALEALAAARTRAGRGWADEPLPLDLRCSPKERGVYVWTRHGLGLELVRVDGWAERFEAHVHGALWIGRYPVTRGEFGPWLNLTDRMDGLIEARILGAGATRVAPDGPVAQADHPVVNVTHAEALAFASWAGLRLPTSAEWTRAAGLDRAPCHLPGDTNPHDPRHHSSCSICDGEGWLPGRPYPWGNEAPTPERCVAAEWREAEEGLVRLLSTPPTLTRAWAGERRTTAPVRDAEGRPARPFGASPCGAMDMVGHVFQFADSGPHVHDLMGSSFRRQREDIGFSRTTDGSDDIGFRVALSEPTA